MPVATAVPGVGAGAVKGWRGPGSVALCLVVCTALASEQRQRLGGPHLEIRYWPAQEDRAYEVRRYAAEAMPLLAQALDLPNDQTVTIDIVRSREEFNNLVGERMPDWTLGVAFHHQFRVVLKPLSGPDLRRLVLHELTHVMLDRKLEKAGAEAPRWVHEGLAQWMEGDMTPAQKDVLGEAAVEGRLLRLGELNAAFEGKRERVDLAYAQSVTLIRYMQEHGPPGALGKFVQYLAQTGDENLALRWAMAQDPAVVEKRWLETTRAQYLARGVPLSVELAIFAFMALLFGVAVVVRLRIARRIRERLQEEERLRQLFQGVDAPDEYLPDTNDEWKLKE